MAYQANPAGRAVPPGGVTDTSGRLVADQLSRRLGQQVIVDNRPGASGNIVRDFVPAGKIGDAILILVANPGVPDFVINSWVGLLAPARTPRTVIVRLKAELNAVLADPEVRDRLNALGIGATPGSAEKFGEEIKRDLARYGQVVKAAGIKAD